MDKKINKMKQALSLAICIMMLLAVSIGRDHQVLGHSWGDSSQKTEESKPEAIQEKEGLQVINTSSLGKDITGYGGNVPLEITIKDGIIQDIKPLKNQETPEFFEQASTLFAQWKGKRVDDAIKLKVDAVSGATFSSKAIIGNMQRGLQLAAKHPATEKTASDSLSLKSIAALLVALLAAILPLFIKNRRYQMIQMILNVVVLGFWCGQFLSYASIIGYLSHGFHGWAVLTPIVLLITAFVYPLLGKKGYYCAHVCPLGSLQQLASQCNKHKPKISAKTLHRLDIFRQLLWVVLMLLLWSGAWANWINYELFTAFIIQSAAWPVMMAAALFIILSLFVQRPYCRFVCPMGTLFKYSQKTKVWWKRK